MNKNITEGRSAFSDPMFLVDSSANAIVYGAIGGF